jgi:hypothetical protein
MSDLSFPRCNQCHQPEHACECDAGCCISCGERLSEEERGRGWDTCFPCYCGHND